MRHSFIIPGTLLVLVALCGIAIAMCPCHPSQPITEHYCSTCLTNIPDALQVEFVGIDHPSETCCFVEDAEHHYTVNVPLEGRIAAFDSCQYIWDTGAGGWGYCYQSPNANQNNYRVSVSPENRSNIVVEISLVGRRVFRGIARTNCITALWDSGGFMVTNEASTYCSHVGGFLFIGAGGVAFIYPSN